MNFVTTVNMALLQISRAKTSLVQLYVGEPVLRIIFKIHEKVQLS